MIEEWMVLVIERDRQKQIETGAALCSVGGGGSASVMQ